MGLVDLVRDWRRLVRYYLVGVINSAFGYGLFAALVWEGTNVYLAQFISHCLGVAFNYFTFSRYTFADRSGSKVRYILSYAGNYALSLVTLLVLSQILASPYLAGLLTILFVSALNYFVLAKLVFAKQVGT